MYTFYSTITLLFKVLFLKCLVLIKGCIHLIKIQYKYCNSVKYCNCK